MRVALLALELLLLSSCEKADTSSKPPSVNEIVRHMRETYATAIAYVDHGISTSEFKSNEPFTMKQTFETAFIRWTGFRFSYDTLPSGELFDFGPEHFVVWQNRHRVLRTWTVTPGEVEEWDELASPLHAAAGISGGVSNTVPILLSSDPFGWGWRTWWLNREPDAIDGHACWRVNGVRLDTRITIWVDQRTNALRHVVTRTAITGASGERVEVQRTTHYEPRFTAPTPAQLQGPDVSDLRIVKHPH